jgi:hypothetical protein
VNDCVCSLEDRSINVSHVNKVLGSQKSLWVWAIARDYTVLKEPCVGSNKFPGRKNPPQIRDDDWADVTQIPSDDDSQANS